MTNSDCRQKALSLLAARPYSKAGLLKKLEAFEEAEQVAGDLEEQGYIDDEAYAAGVVRSQIAKGYGKQRAVRFLTERGIPKDLALEAWEAEDTSPDERIDLCLSKLYKGNTLDAREKNRLSGALQRRGYEWTEIRGAIARLAGNDDCKYEFDEFEGTL